MPSSLRRIHVPCSPTIRQAVEQAAAARRVSMAQVVRECVVAHLGVGEESPAKKEPAE